MATILGLNGAKSRSSRATNLLTKGLINSSLMRFAIDVIELAGSVGAADVIYLGDVPSSAFLDPVLSFLAFDDAGTGVNFSVGIVDADWAAFLSGASTKLASAIDVSTAAGQTSIMASVVIENRMKPLWELLGMTKDPKRPISLYAFPSADPGAMTVQVQICGTV